MQSQMPRSLHAATPTNTRGKSKGNRSIRCIPGGNEPIWDEELLTALIEALNIYPPMGRQRIRPTHDGAEGHASLGRCQLIQQYLMQRTGKIRTRKQISSRVQRMRRMHLDDPEMADVLRAVPHIPRPLAPEMLLNLSDCYEAKPIISPLVPATPLLLGSVGSSASSSPRTDPLGDSYHSSASSSSVQSNQLSLRRFEATDLHVSISGDGEIGLSALGSEQENVWPDPGLGYPDQSVPSLSRKRMSSNIPGLRFQVDLPPGSQFSFTNSGHDFEASTLSVETGCLPLAKNQFPYLSCHGQSGDPITPVDQIIHTPDLPQVLRCDKRSAYQPLCDDKDDLFSQSVACVPSLNPYDPYSSSHFFAAAEYNSSKTSPFHTSRAQNYSFPSSPLASFYAGVQSASSCLLPLEPEDHLDAQTQDVTHLAHLPRRLSYPCDAQLLDSRLSCRMTSAAYSCASEENIVASTPGSVELASPAVIRSFFTSDFSCPGSGGLPHTTFDGLATIHDGPVFSQ